MIGSGGGDGPYSVLLDTSVLIAAESGRGATRPPAEAAISVVTIAELNLGVLAASGASQRARRLATLSYAESTFEPLPIDSEIARVWGRLVESARRAGRRAPVNDCWIAATAVVHGLPVLTLDRDYEGLGVVVVSAY